MSDGMSTRAVHGGGHERTPGEPVAPAVIQSSTFLTKPDGSSTVRYSREGNNPAQERLERLLAGLEGAEDAVVVGSGMAAIALTALAVTRQGDRIVASRDLYGNTRKLFQDELPRRGVDVVLVDPHDPSAWWAAADARTRALYLEMPTNPTLRIPDPEPVVRLGRERGVPVLADVTFASPVNLRPAELGISASIHSATKYLGGHSDLVAGVVSGPRDLMEEVRRGLRLYGAVLDPHALWMLERSLRTLTLRVERQNRNAAHLAEVMEGRAGVRSVVHPGRESHPDHARAQELMDGYGGMLGVILEGGGPAADRFMEEVRLALSAPSLGGVETLVSQPRHTSHRHMSREARTEQGIPDGFVRVSVGVEDPGDLERDFVQALEATLQGETEVQSPG